MKYSLEGIDNLPELVQEVGAVPAYTKEEVTSSDMAFAGPEFQDFIYGLSPKVGYSGHAIEVEISETGNGFMAQLDGDPQKASDTDQKVIDWLEQNGDKIG